MIERFTGISDACFFTRDVLVNRLPTSSLSAQWFNKLPTNGDAFHITLKRTLRWLNSGGQVEWSHDDRLAWDKVIHRR